MNTKFKNLFTIVLLGFSLGSHQSVLALWYPYWLRFIAAKIVSPIDKFCASRLIRRIGKIAGALPSVECDELGYIDAKVLPEGSQIICIGDLHGDVQSLQNDLCDLKNNKIIDDHNVVLKNAYIVCLGDYTDRGQDGLAVWEKLLELKDKNFDQIWLLRGNHEHGELAATQGGFWGELRAKFRLHDGPVRNAFLQLWEKLPLAVFLGLKSQSGKIDYIQFCHGGIDENFFPHIWSALNGAIEYNNLVRQMVQADNGNLVRSRGWPSRGLIWNDFCAKDNSLPFKGTSSRGVVRAYNAASVCNYLNKIAGANYDVYCIIRAHEHIVGNIVVLRKSADRSIKNSMLQEWRPLRHGREEPIERGAVFTCTSTPTVWVGGGPQINRDAYAIVKMSPSGLQITPRILRRVSWSIRGCLRSLINIV